MPFDYSKFYFGVNIGWFDNFYGHDLGARFQQTYGSDPNTLNEFELRVGAYFTHLELRRITVVRIWVFEDFEGLDLAGGTSSVAATLTCNPSERFSYVPDSDPRYGGGRGSFIARIRAIMTAARTHHLQIYWCLFDGAMTLNPTDEGIRARRFINCLSLPGKKNNFRVKPKLYILHFYDSKNLGGHSCAIRDTPSISLASFLPLTASFLRRNFQGLPCEPQFPGQLPQV